MVRRMKPYIPYLTDMLEVAAFAGTAMLMTVGVLLLR